MKRPLTNRIAAAGLMSLLVAAAAGARQSEVTASQASGESAEGVAAMIESGAKVTSGAVAVPLASAAATAGAVDSTADAIADDLWTAANAPLSIDDDVVVSPDGPPAVPRDGADEPSEDGTDE